MTQHDNSYKLFFSHPEMVRDLLAGFIHQPWVAELDLTTLEIVSGSYVADDLRDREDDIIWRVRLRDRWLYLYLLLEFQSTVDAHMAVGVLSYLGLLYQDLIKQKQFTPNGLLPPVLPVVLYNGKPRWRAALNISQLIEAPPGRLRDYTPQLKYLLLGRWCHRRIFATGSAQPGSGTVWDGEKPWCGQCRPDCRAAGKLAGSARTGQFATRFCCLDQTRISAWALARR